MGGSPAQSQNQISQKRQERRALLDSILEEDQAKFDAQQKRHPAELQQKISDMKQEASARSEIVHQEKEKMAQETLKHILSTYPEMLIRLPQDKFSCIVCTMSESNAVA